MSGKSWRNGLRVLNGFFSASFFFELFGVEHQNGELCRAFHVAGELLIVLFLQLFRWWFFDFFQTAGQ